MLIQPVRSVKLVVAQPFDAAGRAGVAPLTTSVVSLDEVS